MSFSKNEKKEIDFNSTPKALYNRERKRTKTKTKQYKNIKWTILSRLFFILSTHTKKQQR